MAKDITYNVFYRNELGAVIIDSLKENQRTILYKYLNSQIPEIKFENNKVRIKIVSNQQNNLFILIIATAPKHKISQNIVENYYDLLLDVISNIEESTQKIKNDTRRILHNIISLNSINTQEFDSIFPPEILYNLSHKKIISYMETEITEKPKRMARSILKINKNNNEIKYELETFRHLMNPHAELRKSKQNVHRVTKRILDTFFVDFLDCNIDVILSTENNKIIECSLNFDCLRYAIYNLFDNALKYAQKNSAITVTISSSEKDIVIEFNMISRIIGKDEVDKIFVEGYRGKSVKDSLNGNGIGLYMAQEMLKRINSKIVLEQKEFVEYKSITYQKNIFKLIVTL